MISYIFVFTAVILWLAWLCQSILLQKLGFEIDPQRLGSWGDSFGALNSLFALLGFVAALQTLNNQNSEITASKRQKHKDDFDKTFFQLIDLFREVRKEVRFVHSQEYLDVQPSARREEGYNLEAFRLAWYELRYYLSDKNIIRPDAAAIYRNKIYKRAESTLGPYFRIFYTILSRIKNETGLSEKEKIYYANLFRAQLSSHEIAVAALNGLNEFSSDLSDLIIEFRLLKYATQKRLVITKRYYPDQAFEARD